MKKQLIIVGSTVLVMLLLFGAYLAFFKVSNIIDTSDPFYTLSDKVKAEIEKIDAKTEIIVSGASEESVQGDEYLNRAYKFAIVFNKTNKKIKVGFDKNASFYGIVIKKGNDSKQFGLDELYKKLADGTRFAFDGERLFTNAILSLNGKQELEGVQLKALPGYDTQGDLVIQATGYPFLYPNITRNDVKSITVKNEFGSYKSFKAKDGNFYFEGAEHISYNPEMFSSLVVNSTYVLSIGKVQDPKELSEYGLADESKATAVITVVTLKDETHKIIIGDLSPTGAFYYAKYFNKDFVYMIKASDLSTAILQPLTSYLTATLVNSISETNDIYGVNDIIIKYPESGTTLTAKLHSLIFASSNITPYKQTDVVKTLTDKVDFKGSYTNWTETPSFAGFTSKDNKNVYLDMPLRKYSDNGRYSVSFGLLKDEQNYAYLPGDFKAEYSTDGLAYTAIDVSGLSFSQGNKELKRYSFEFSSDKPVLFVRITFGVGNGKYIVLDEITVYADGVDAQPNDGVLGGWKLTGPSDIIPVGMNYVYPNNNFPNTFLMSLVTLSADKVLDYGIAKDTSKPDTISAEKLTKYGLDKPYLVASFTFKGVKSEVYFSHKDPETGVYYCYSVISGVVDGKKIEICTDVIAQISAEKAPWLEWDTLDYMEHSLISMYLDQINSITIKTDGKEYAFKMNIGDDEKISSITLDGKEIDVKNFRYFYVSLLSVNLRDEYKPAGETATEIMRIKIESKSKSPEIVFYRISTSKAYYTIDGQGGNYVTMDSLNTVKANLKLLLEGKEVPHR